MPVVKFINGQFVVPKVRIAFVSFSSGRYLGQERGLVASVHKYCPAADVFVFHTVEEIGSPSHDISPYSFKVHSIEKVRHFGYEVIIWCDSVIRVNKPIEPLLPIVSSLGVYLAEDGWKSGQWANDKALEYFHLTRDEAMQIETIYACIMMFDFRNPITDQFFQRWKEASYCGIFRGNWSNKEKTESQDERCLGHRHDQTCADLIAHQLGIPRGKALIGDKSDKYFTSFRYPS